MLVRIMYDKERKQFLVSNQAYTNLARSELSSAPMDSAVAYSQIEKDNALLASGALRIRLCQDCRKFFTNEASEIHWMYTHGLSRPKRCHSCRNVNRMTF